MQLPEELQWEIMGWLSVRSLCTARLVSKDFHRSASCHLKALWIPCNTLQQPRSNIFTQLSGLTRVKVSLENDAQLHLLAHPRIAPFITHVLVKQVMSVSTLAPLSLASPGDEQPPNDLAHLNLLPRLRSLSLRDDISKVELVPLRLQGAFFWGQTSGSVTPVTRLLGLTSLTIDVLSGAVSSLGSLTCLTKLHTLRLVCESGPPGMLSTLTRLTQLCVIIKGTRTTQESMFSDLVHLTRLAHLRVPYSNVDLTLEDLAFLAHLTKLTGLSFFRSPLGECLAGSSVLVSLTNLAYLTIPGGPLGISLLSNVNVKGFRWLVLLGSCGDISVLQRATGLMWLELEWGREGAEYLPELGPTLARMSELRHLVLHVEDEVDSPEIFHLSPVLPALTKLTYLEYKGSFTVGDLGACAALPNLRKLVLRGTCEVTAACVPALQAMSGLDELKLLNTGIHEDELTPEVRAGFGVEQLRHGWARLRLHCENT
jgi:hypothetical protein